MPTAGLVDGKASVADGGSSAGGSVAVGAVEEKPGSFGSDSGVWRIIL